MHTPPQHGKRERMTAKEIAMALNTHGALRSNVDKLIHNYLIKYVSKEAFRTNRDNIKGMLAWMCDKKDQVDWMSVKEAHWLKQSLDSMRDRYDFFLECNFFTVDVPVLSNSPS